MRYTVFYLYYISDIQADRECGSCANVGQCGCSALLVLITIWIDYSSVFLLRLHVMCCLFMARLKIIALQTFDVFIHRWQPCSINSQYHIASYRLDCWHWCFDPQEKALLRSHWLLSMPLNFVIEVRNTLTFRFVQGAGLHKISRLSELR